MYTWKIKSAVPPDLEDKLNALEAEGWEIFSVMDSPDYFIIVCRKPNET